MTDLISINEAAERGVERVRKSIWADPMDHLKIDIIDGKPGPWLHLYCPFNKECNGRDPVDILWPISSAPPVDPALAEFVPYEGPLPDSDAYQQRAASFAGVLSESKS